MNSDQKPLMDQKKTKTSPFHWEFGRHLIHHRLGRSHSPPQMAPLYNYATKFPLVTTYNGRPTFTPKNCPFPWGRSPPQLLASSLDAANLPPQTASRYNQPFYHNTPDRQTDTQTHRLTDGLGDVTCTKSPRPAYALLIMATRLIIKRPVLFIDNSIKVPVNPATFNFITTSRTCCEKVIGLSLILVFIRKSSLDKNLQSTLIKPFTVLTRIIWCYFIAL